MRTLIKIIPYWPRDRHRVIMSSELYSVMKTSMLYVKKEVNTENEGEWKCGCGGAVGHNRKWGIQAKHQ